VGIRNRLPPSLAADLDRLYREYLDDRFEIRDSIADFEKEGYYDGFKGFCRECTQRTFQIDNVETSLDGLEKHLKSARHTSNVLLRLKREGKVPQKTPACTLRVESIHRLADQKEYSPDNMSLFIEHCATGSFSVPAPLAEGSGNVPRMNQSTDKSISQGETSKPSATPKGPLFGRTQEEADQDRAFLNSMFDAQLPHITNPKAQVTTPVESQSLAALRSDFSPRLDALEGGDRNKQLQLDRHEKCITGADAKIRVMEKKIKDLQEFRDDCISAINREQESMRISIQKLETAQKRSSTRVDGVSETVNKLETRTANVRTLTLEHHDIITGIRTQGAETRASLESLKRRCEQSDKSERHMKRRILDLENREKDVQKENQAFRKKTKDRFETLLGIIQNFETLSKRQKDDVDALKKEVKDLEMVGEQQKSQISNLKTQLSLQIAQIEGTGTRRRSTRGTAAASL
jgi:prefoldin subunit 5